MQKVPDTGRTALLVIELSSGTATLHGEEVELPFREFTLLAELARRVGEPAPSPELIAAVWPDEPWTPKENLYMLVTRLRRLIDGPTKFGKHIRNRRGFGYFLDLDPDDVVVAEHAAAHSAQESVIRLDDATAPQQQPADVELSSAAPEQPAQEPVGNASPRKGEPRLRVLTAGMLGLGLIAASWSAGYVLSSRSASRTEARGDASIQAPDQGSLRPNEPQRSRSDRARADRTKVQPRKKPAKKQSRRTAAVGQSAPLAAGPWASTQPPGSKPQAPAQSQPRSQSSTQASGKASPPPPEPALPPAPTRYLYHLFNEKTGDHFVTTDGNVVSEREAMGYRGGAVGRVYTSQVAGTKPIPTNHGTAYVFVSSSPKTEPHSRAVALWYSTNNAGDFFYTTNQAEARQSGWQASVIGYVRSP